ncbi:peptide chain release factor N(5)-glutamine methyltransferase [Hymenobacter sp. DH14]|uniref:peptide chain release factor N(5)-glutamine methyltransferase n=1 Tax=Hymenobacter cyanobacteriorum TaxID=2926463 RepID=A0A9X1VH53_9BACT|nr:peptide chain release factor N(5)-glutamine methyltransferase [Hymenobacter cyanobacteriorum]MCI1188593.1 peptide chain release factor N(5)-glutamine methyltransferase [Hymenobacter cyanobacteriorum]
MMLRDATAALTAALAALYPAHEAEAIATLVFQQLLQLEPLPFRMAAREAVAPEIMTQLPAIEARLLAHEPVQYVLGTAHFAGMDLEVTPATLIPRPETEELVQLIAQEQASRPGRRVLDVGTGSGCLALALARALPGAEVLAVDISAEALAVARRNAAMWAPMVAFQQVDILTQLPAGLAPGALDVLVSNPPYVRESERAEMRENVLAWEPATALFVPDEDPLLFYRRLAEIGAQLLAADGVAYLEINEALGAETAALFTAQGFADVRVVADMFGRPRMVRAARGGGVGEER